MIYIHSIIVLVMICFLGSDNMSSDEIFIIIWMVAIWDKLEKDN